MTIGYLNWLGRHSSFMIEKITIEDTALDTSAPHDSNDAVDTALSIVEVAHSHFIAHCWSPANMELLARLIAIIAMGQAAHAADVITGLSPTEPGLNHTALRKAAESNLRVVAAHRDGFIFEAISWIAAQQGTNGNALLRDPHIKSTTQGLDGLMIEITAEGEISRTTIFEDKCSKHPRNKFRDEILPAFKNHHEHKRAPELLAAGAALLKQAGLNGRAAEAAAERVLNLQYRAYRGSVTVTAKDDTPNGREALFKGYDELAGLEREQRIGGTFVTPAHLRDWFEELAAQAIAYINALEETDAYV